MRRAVRGEFGGTDVPGPREPGADGDGRLLVPEGAGRAGVEGRVEGRVAVEGQVEDVVITGVSRRVNVQYTYLKENERGGDEENDGTSCSTPFLVKTKDVLCKISDFVC